MSEGRKLELPALAASVLLALSAAKLLLHLLTNGNYGFFIDELYYIACSEHLDFGYVDHPPMIALVTWLVRALLGDSLPALRLFPALAGAATVFVAGMIAREFGGGRFAQLSAGLAVIISPILLFMNTILSMNALDTLIWTLAAWILVQIINRGRELEQGDSNRLSVPRLWLVLGLVLGIGLENKISVLFFGFGLAVGLVLTPERKHLKTPWPWLAGAISLALFLPHILWQVAHEWPTLEFMHNATTLKNRPMAVSEFFFVQFLELHPLNFVLLLLGLWLFFISGRGKPYRLFGWIYLAFLAVLLTRNGKPYYAATIYPLMLAGGAVATERLLAWTTRAWPRVAIVATLAVGGVVTAPMTLPALPVETFIRYQEFALGGPPGSSENKEVGPLPQHFADMFGNEELAAIVAEVYHELSAEEQSRCVIYGMAYPQAGAIDVFGSRYNLPKAISGHNAYWTWGPGELSGEIMIVMGLNEEILSGMFADVTEARVFRHPYAMPWRNNMPIYLCRQPRVPLQSVWSKFKHYE
jgi:hypothetical protein